MYFMCSGKCVQKTCFRILSKKIYSGKFQKLYCGNHVLEIPRSLFWKISERVKYHLKRMGAQLEVLGMLKEKA